MERDSALVLDHLAEAGPSTRDELKTELGLKPKELRQILSPLERCGAVVGRAIDPGEDGEVEGFEYLRWDQLLVDATDGPATLDALIGEAVRAAVLASEREVPRWFSWRSRFEPDLLDRLVGEGKLMRPAPGWVATPASA